MGASEWRYLVPYQADIRKAFDSLQADVFQSRNYSSLWTKSEALQHYEEQLEEVEQDYEDDYTREEVIEDLTGRLTRLKSLPEATTLSEKIDELRAVNAEEGTHSILDMRGISEEPNFMQVAPLKDEELVSIFGTTQPTRELVEQVHDSIMGFRHTWMGTYIVLYKDGKPDEIMFVGVSGD